MRLFVAVPISDAVRAAVRVFRDGLALDPELAKKAKWVRPEHWHLTLKFFGEVPGGGKVEALKFCLLEAAASLAPFSVDVRGAGCFPEAQRPKVLWLGVERGADGLNSLARSVEEKSAAQGFPPADKPFSPHLTVARFPSGPPRGLAALLAQRAAESFGTLSVDAVHLVQSRLTPAGPEYTDLEVFALGH